MNLLLMSARSPYLDGEKIYPPLGLLYLKAAVDRELPHIKIDITDNYSLENINEFYKYDMIGISVMTPQRVETYRILNMIKEVYPTKKMIIGGPHVLHYLDEVKESKFDYIVPKDGQRSLIKILKGEAKRVEIDQMSKEEWAKQPRPDRTSYEARKFLFDYNYELNGKPATTILTSTGCPMKCTFCEDAMTQVRWSPLEKICEELNDIQDLGKSAVYIFDDLFAIAMPKVKPIVEELSKRDLIYRCNGQANYFTKWGEDFAKLLSDTGCYEIAFGHETGSQQILDNTRKQTTIEQNYQSIEFARKYGLKVKSFLMIGLPGETYETIAETEKFIREAQPDDFQLCIYYPYRGTQIREQIERGESDMFFYGEGLGAYGQKGGNTEAVIGNDKLNPSDLLNERDRIVRKYKPESHKPKFDDGFFVSDDEKEEYNRILQLKYLEHLES